MMKGTTNDGMETTLACCIEIPLHLIFIARMKAGVASSTIIVCVIIGCIPGSICVYCTSRMRLSTLQITMP